MSALGKDRACRRARSPGKGSQDRGLHNANERLIDLRSDRAVYNGQKQAENGWKRKERMRDWSGYLLGATCKTIFISRPGHTTQRMHRPVQSSSPISAKQGLYESLKVADRGSTLECTPSRGLGRHGSRRTPGGSVSKLSSATRIISSPRLNLSDWACNMLSLRLACSPTARAYVLNRCFLASMQAGFQPSPRLKKAPPA